LYQTYPLLIFGIWRKTSSKCKQLSYWQYPAISESGQPDQVFNNVLDQYFFLIRVRMNSIVSDFQTSRRMLCHSFSLSDKDNAVLMPIKEIFKAGLLQSFRQQNLVWIFTRDVSPVKKIPKNHIRL
jgi:hypothetical protein